MSKIHKNSFASILLNWHETIDRSLPWKSSNDPYKIWLSEIIMQQTRIAQGTPYYLKFVEAFPTIIDLANADEANVMKLWQGLGYYSRARNLHYTAKTIRDEYNGVFPNDYGDILALKGVGKYTAAAISSFAYGHEYPVVDGNVIRLISRYFGITAPVDISQTQKEINHLAEKLIKGIDPGKYNQAIMDFGALMCSPKAPKCMNCPFNNECIANTTGQVNTIPFKSKKIKKTDRFFHYFYILDDRNNIILNQRKNKDIWHSLYDFPSIENKQKEPITSNDINKFLKETIGKKALEINMPTKVYKHLLTHQTIYGQFYSVSLKQLPQNIEPFISVQLDNVDSYAFPKLISNYLEDKVISLF